VATVEPMVSEIVLECDESMRESVIQTSSFIEINHRDIFLV
jgi:hypothetical protein